MPPSQERTQAARLGSLLLCVALGRKSLAIVIREECFFKVSPLLSSPIEGQQVRANCSITSGREMKGQEMAAVAPGGNICRKSSAPENEVLMNVQPRLRGRGSPQCAGKPPSCAEELGGSGVRQGSLSFLGPRSGQWRDQDSCGQARRFPYGGSAASLAARAALHLRALSLLLSILPGLQMEVHIYGLQEMQAGSCSIPE